MNQERIKAFCIDFNWDLLGRFASPGLYAAASAREHLQWYKELGVNTIQSFCVSHNGYAWYKSDVAPRTPGMNGDFFAELTELGHKEGMTMMGYFSPSANSYWLSRQPQLSQPAVWNRAHVPFTNAFLDYLGRMIRDALEKIPMDGFMIDFLYNPDPIWMPCEIELYEQLMGGKFPGAGGVEKAEITEYNRRANERCWNVIYEVTKSINKNCLIWFNSADLNDPAIRDTVVLSQCDWLMNENPKPDALKTAPARKGANTRLIQCTCGWESPDPTMNHDAGIILGNPEFAEVGIYGFAKPDPFTTLPPQNGGRNAQNIALMERSFQQS